MLLCVTASHRTADFDLLDRVSRGSRRPRPPGRRHRLRARRRRARHLQPVRGLPRARRAADRRRADRDRGGVHALAASVGADAAELRRTAEVLGGDDVADHLFAVSSGLESLVLGEEEIGGQVQRALATARSRARRRAGWSACSSAPPAPRARCGRTPISAAPAARSRASRSTWPRAGSPTGRRPGCWSSAPGGTRRPRSRPCATRGARHPGVLGDRTRRTVRARYGVHAEHDLSTRSGMPRSSSPARRAIRWSPRRPPTSPPMTSASRLVIDLGLPRNVEPAVGALPGVELIDLEVLALHAPLPELEPGARALVGSAADAVRGRGAAAPAIVALRRHVFDALDAELPRARARDRGNRPLPNWPARSRPSGTWRACCFTRRRCAPANSQSRAAARSSRRRSPRCTASGWKK